MVGAENSDREYGWQALVGRVTLSTIPSYTTGRKREIASGGPTNTRGCDADTFANLANDDCMSIQRQLSNGLDRTEPAGGWRQRDKFFLPRVVSLHLS